MKALSFVRLVLVIAYPRKQAVTRASKPRLGERRPLRARCFDRVGVYGPFV
jgi:hypothetical protein